MLGGEATTEMDRLDRLEAAIEELAARDRRLSERVDALAHRLELLALLHKENEARVTQIMDTMNRLPNIVSSHEERLDDLEGR